MFIRVPDSSCLYDWISLFTVNAIDLRSNAIFLVSNPGREGFVPTTDAAFPVPNSIVLGSSVAASEFLAMWRGREVHS